MKQTSERTKHLRNICKLKRIIFFLAIYSAIISIFYICEIYHNNKVQAMNELYCYNSGIIEPVKYELTPPKEKAVEKNTETFVLTAYCPCRKCNGKWAGGITSTRVKAQAGRTIAVDPRIIPYGTKVIIDGHTYIAEDCGGAIKGNRIDVYFDTHQEALNFGRQTKQVTILN